MKSTLSLRAAVMVALTAGLAGWLFSQTPAPPAAAAVLEVVNESGNGLTNLRGTVGLARPSDPHAGDCQFYVNLFDNGALDPNQTRWGYAVFGKIVQGMDVVDRIGNVATGARGPFKEDAPLQPVVIERIERVAHNRAVGDALGARTLALPSRR